MERNKFEYDFLIQTFKDKIKRFGKIRRYEFSPYEREKGKQTYSLIPTRYCIIYSNIEDSEIRSMQRIVDNLISELYIGLVT